MGVVAAFEVALAAGAPWGIAAFGGQNEGVLPAPLRATGGVAALVYAALIAITLRPRPTRWRRITLFAWSGIFLLGVVMNAASPSAIERAIWTPVTLLLTLSVFFTARDPGT